MKVSIYTISKTLFEGESIGLIIPTKTGQITILDNHEPLTTIADRGEILITLPDRTEQSFKIQSGIIQVLPENKAVLNVNALFE